MLENITVILIVLICFIYFFGKKRSQPFPGPKGLPFCGVAFQIDKKRLHLTLYEWTKTYGDIFQFEVFGKTYVSLNSPGIMREVMGQEPTATITSSREPSFFGHYIIGKDTDIIFSSYSRSWLQRRKVGSQIIQAYGEGMLPLKDEIYQILRDLKEFIGDIQGQDVYPDRLLESYLLKDLASLVSGTVDEVLQKHIREMDDNSNEIALPMFDLIFQMVPSLRFLPFPITRKPFLVIQSIAKMMESIKELTAENSIERGMYYELKNAGRKYGHHLTEEEIRGIIVNLIGAGFLTSRGILMSLLHLLAEHPEIQRRIHEEVDDVIGQREATVDDRGSCPFTEAVLLETTRIISHLPLGAPHLTTENCFIRGIMVKKGSIILPNLWTINHSDDWDDPFNFRPERFLDESGKLLPATHRNRKRLMAFGYGKRSCLGEVFAKNRAFLFLATLMQTCTVAKPAGGTLQKFDPRAMTPGVELQPQPFKVQFVPRACGDKKSTRIHR